jgi:HEAT repeat protein
MPTTVLLLAALAFPRSPAAPAPEPVAEPIVGAVQDPAPNTNPDKRPEIEQKLSKLEGHMRKEGKQDTEAVAVIDELLQEFSKCGPKDRQAVVKTLSKSFEQRRMVPEGEALNNKLFIASAVALGKMGPESVDVLTTWIDHKNHRKDLALQYRLIKSLGETKDKRAIKLLKNLLLHKENALISAAAESLGEYAGADLETRKDAFEALLKTLMEAKGNKDSDTNNTIAREKYDVIGAPIITSLGKLSKHDERVPEEWQKWWNKNKKDDWDKDA